MARDYVEKREGGYYIVGSRVALESIVYEFLEGVSPETIVDDFPTLTLEQVYGAVAFFLGNRAELEHYLAETEKLWDERRRNAPSLPAGLRERIKRARLELNSKRA